MYYCSRFLSIVAILVFPGMLFAAYDATEYVDLHGQITNTSHGDSSTTIDIAVRTRQQLVYPYATSIVVACYDAKQYDTRQTKVASTTLQIQGISSTVSAHTSLTIPKTNKVQTILCHIDDTNAIPELNDSNRVGRVHVDAKKGGTTTPTPITPQPTKPSPPIYRPIPDPICKPTPVEICEEKTLPARGDKYMSQLGLNIPTSLADITSYRIQWFNGSRSQRYTPGVHDIDWKDNCGNTYPKGETATIPPSCARRIWSYFDDHTYQIKTCTENTEKQCDTDLPEKKKRKKRQDKRQEQEKYRERVIDQPVCRGSYCGRTLPPITKRLPKQTPIAQDPPVYRPTPKTNTDLSPCYGADCRRDAGIYYRSNGSSSSKTEHRRIVDPQAINTEFEWLSRLY